MEYTLQIYILLFFIYSFLGWLMEVVRLYLNPKIHRLINRGFLIGPYLPIYGFGVIAITILLGKYRNDIPALFWLSMITCGILEYATSYIMEKLFSARWWDYSNRKFNINGRICLETLLPFGIAGTLVVCIINPIFINFINMLPVTIINFLCGGLIVIISVDTIISFTVISTLKNTANEIDLSEDDDTENISNFVKDKAEDIAMQIESDIRKDFRKRKLKSQRKLLHIRLRADKKFRAAKLQSQKIRSDFTKDINNKVNTLKANSEDLTLKIKSNFSGKSILNKRLLDAFPDLQILDIRRIKEKIKKHK